MCGRERAEEAEIKENLDKEEVITTCVLLVFITARNSVTNKNELMNKQL